MQLKILDSDLTCKVANKCLDVRELVEIVESNKKWSPAFPYCPVNHQCLLKKTPTEKNHSPKTVRYDEVPKKNNFPEFLRKKTTRETYVQLK